MGRTKTDIRSRISTVVVVLVAAALFFAFNALTNGRFLSGSNLNSLFTQPVVATFLSWGIFFIFTSGTMDMSLGANLMLASNIGAMLALEAGMGYAGLIVGAMVSAVVMAVLSMTVCMFLKIPSWISSLGMAMVYEAVLNIISTYRLNTFGKTLPSFLFQFREIGQFPYCTIIWVVGLIAACILFNLTNVGINIRALGCNVSVAENMGLNRIRALYSAAIVGGIFVGLAATVNMSYAGTVRAVSGLTSVNQLFKPIAAWMLAQAFERQINLPIGILVFSFFITAFFNFLTFIGAPTGTIQEMCLGAMVILFAALAKRGFRGVAK